MIDLELFAAVGFDLDLYVEEVSQWADPHQLEASAEAVFAIAFDLSGFGEDENLPPAPHSLLVRGAA